MRPKYIALYPSETPIPVQKIPVNTLISKEVAPQAEPRAPNVVLPLDKYRITSGFGWRKHPVTGKRDFHNGVDLAAYTAPVLSIMAGKVEETGYNQNLGKYVRIDHGTVHSIYGHLSRIAVRNGQLISTGDPVGITGKTGRATGEHLHFSVRIKGTYIDPWKFLHGVIQYSEIKH